MTNGRMVVRMLLTVSIFAGCAGSSSEEANTAVEQRENTGTTFSDESTQNDEPFLSTDVAAAPDEPPFSFGEGAGGTLRSTKLQDIKENGEAVYTVNYPGFGLTSHATVRLSSGTTLSEVFPGKWYVAYAYEDPMHVALQLPDRITVATDENGSPGRIINTYTLVGLPGGGFAEYEGMSGTRRTIHMAYFEIGQSPIGR